MMEFSFRSQCVLFVLLWGGLLLFSCQHSTSLTYSSEEYQKTDSLIRISPSVDSLTNLLKHYIVDANLLGAMLANKELGKRYHETAQFYEAIYFYRKELELAMQIKDTLNAIEALNNIGTNFRRMGILNEASTSHYSALQLCEQFNDKKSSIAKKNRVVSLNGIGNVHLTLDNREAADSVFRLALAGERELQSDLGQAINYANLGSIFKARGMIDSALVYYRYSMKYNRAAKSTLGISLCHNHFGHIFEQKGQWEDALREYRNAYNLMSNSSDRWHWLESCLALARVYILKGDITTAREYLVLAEKTAKETRSWEYLSEVHHLYYLCYKENGDCNRALDSYILSHTYSDSVKNTANQNHVQNLRINYERIRSNRELSLIQANYQIEQRTNNILLKSSLAVVFVMLVAMVFLWYALRMKSHNQRIMRNMEKVRNIFFTNVTHEFRTPLTVILGLSAQLQKNDITSEERKNGLIGIARQGRSLLALVNQLLEVSKVKSEIGEPEWQHGDIVAYMQMFIESYRAYTRQKQIDLRLISSDTVIMIDFVPEYFCTILRNLLSNAVKFTPKSGVIIATIKKETEKLIIHIADSGTGISKEDLPHIFDAFYQGENSASKMGTGIGLAMVKQMIESMEGTISVESTLGKGSTFIINLPLKHNGIVLEQWSPEKQLKVDMECSAPDNTRPTVLIVEDNTDISYYIGGVLKDNYHLIYACDGVEGFEKANEILPDLIITDLMMPEKDGKQLCREIRQSDILNHIPIIIITAKCNEKDRVELLDAGADAYLYKPFNTDELHVRVIRLLEQRRLLREKYSRALHEGGELPVDLSIADKNFLNRLNDVVYAMMKNANLSSEMVADKMCISLSQLNRKIKAITGFSSSGYILQMRLDKAKRMLTSTDIPIGDIAMKCGFPEMSYFSRIFKQTFQQTPSQYRKTLQ